MSHDSHDHDSPEYLKKQSRLIWKIGAWLIFFTCLTVWLQYVDFGSHNRNVVIGLLLAAFKASLVALIFMHLKGERGLIYKFLAFTVIFVIGLFALTFLAWSHPLFHAGLF
jgi:cytochrome c oxidase subunit IV